MHDGRLSNSQSSSGISGRRTRQLCLPGVRRDAASPGILRCRSIGYSFFTGDQNRRDVDLSDRLFRQTTPARGSVRPGQFAFCIGRSRELCAGTERHAQDCGRHAGWHFNGSTSPCHSGGSLYRSGGNSARKEGVRNHEPEDHRDESWSGLHRKRLGGIDRDRRQLAGNAGFDDTCDLRFTVWDRYRFQPRSLAYDWRNWRCLVDYIAVGNAAGNPLPASIRAAISGRCRRLGVDHHRPLCPGAVRTRQTRRNTATRLPRRQK